MSALVISPRQAYELARLADRHGPAIARETVEGRLLVLLDRDGGGRPDLALELDTDGVTVARQQLSAFSFLVVPDQGAPMSAANGEAPDWAGILRPEGQAA